MFLRSYIYIRSPSFNLVVLFTFYIPLFVKKWKIVTKSIITFQHLAFSSGTRFLLHQAFKGINFTQIFIWVCFISLVHQVHQLGFMFMAISVFLCVRFSKLWTLLKSLSGFASFYFFINVITWGLLFSCSCYIAIVVFLNLWMFANSYNLLN